jgi:hypothetical protein
MECYRRAMIGEPTANSTAVGGKGPDAQLDQWAITIRFEDENT